jgi:L-rhamnose mutarotase
LTEHRRSGRACFSFRVWPAHIDEYRSVHEEVWPEMQQALQRSGWKNYSLFLAADGLVVGIVDVEDLESAAALMQQEPVNERWQGLVTPFVATDGLAPDRALAPLREIFHLP